MLRIASCFAVSLLAASALPASAQTPPPASLSACYNAINGNLRLVSSSADCRTGERFTSWSTSGGPPGPPGADGAPGPAGPPGPPGTGGGGIDKTRVYMNIASIDVPEGPAPAVEADAFCNDANDVVLSGGFYRAHLGLEIFSSYPLLVPAGPAGWHVGVTSVGAPGLAQAVVVCLAVD